MFSWGEHGTAAGGKHTLDLNFQMTDFSAGRNVTAFLKSNGNAFITRTNKRKDGGVARGKRRFVKCKEKIQTVRCGDDVVTLLSDRGSILYVDTTSSPFAARPLAVLSDIPVGQVACGSQHSLAVTTYGQVYTWGQDSRGQLGLGKGKSSTNSPQQLRCLSSIPVVQVAAGGDQSFALSISGSVFSWGSNNSGQLGLGDTIDRHTPTLVHYLNMKKIIQISCGQSHTATLTKDGAVLTFGSGQYGQLGHSSFRDELHPRFVAELWGAKVIKIACGRNHTLVLTDSKRVYSFGCGQQGQLGHGEESHCSVPLPVELPQELSQAQIRSIYAGDNSSFATVWLNEEATETHSQTRRMEIHEGSTGQTINDITPCLEDLVAKLPSKYDSKSWKKTKDGIHRMFSRFSCVNWSFLERRGDKHFQTSTTYSGLNLFNARKAFKTLMRNENVSAEVEAAVMHLLHSLDPHPLGVEGLRIYLLLIELLCAINAEKMLHKTKLAEAISAALLRLPTHNLEVIENWWSSLPLSHKVKHIGVWKKAFSLVVSTVPTPHNTGVRNLLLVLQWFYNVNNRIAGARRIQESDFCLSFDKTFLHEEVSLWYTWSQGRNFSSQPPILNEFPFVMDLGTKKYIFDFYSFVCKQAVIMSIMRTYGMQMVHPWMLNIFTLTLDVTTASVLKDTFQQLAAINHAQYKKPLVVYFDGNPEVDQVNTKDLFHQVFHEMVSDGSEMFIFNDTKTLAWFPSNASPNNKYFLFGVLCGLAFYNQCIIHLPFPLVLFKKLLDIKPSLEDMIEFNPSTGKTLQCILEEYTDDNIAHLDMDFVINWDGTTVDLDPDNPEKLLTSQNKKDFVDAFVTYVFDKSVENVFQQFRQGFYMVCVRDVVKLFQPKQLQEVLVGKDFQNWAELKRNTVYREGYHEHHPNIQMFWEVFDEFTENQKTTFLWFVTGFERVRVTEAIKMIVEPRQGQDNEYFPESHTCFSLLQLPIYPTKEIMRTMMTEALRKHKITSKQ